MSTSGTGLSEGGNLVANSDLSSSQFLAVKQTATGRAVDLANTGGENITGILQNNPVAAAAAEVCYTGFCKAKLGATVAAGAALMTDTSGRLITQTSTNAKVAVAHEAGVVNQIVLVRVVGTPG
jgi:hypothetical protein